jgi:hypothetical protein
MMGIIILDMRVMAGVYYADFYNRRRNHHYRIHITNLDLLNKPVQDEIGNGWHDKNRKSPGGFLENEIIV